MLSYDVVEWGKPLQKMERDSPRPTGTQLLLKVKYCGVCHSDVHIRDGYFELGAGRRYHMTERGMKPPVTLGHEIHGTIVEAGPDAGDVPVGAERLVYPWMGCGECARCNEELDNFCMAPSYLGIHRPGGYADHLLVPHPRYLIDASGIEPVWAATLSCSGLSAYAAVTKLNPIPENEWIAIMGVGGLGLSAIAMLRALGHERIVAIDIDAAKLQAAKQTGAAAILNSCEVDPLAKLRELTDGSIYGAIDLVGSSDTASLALGALRKGGRLVLVGLYGGEIPLSIVTTIQRALMIQGSHLGTLSELRAVVALAQNGKLKPIPVETRPLSEVSRTLDELKAGKIIGRIVVRS